MNPDEWNDLIAAGLRRPLLPAEENALRSFLAAAEADEELLLQRALRELRRLPVSSNFTARVLSAASAETRQRKSPWPRLLAPRRGGHRGWAYACASAALISAAGFTVYFQHARDVRAERAQVLTDVSTAGFVPTVEMLKDFDAINQLSQAPPSAELDRLLGELK